MYIDKSVITNILLNIDDKNINIIIIIKDIK